MRKAANASARPITHRIHGMLAADHLMWALLGVVSLFFLRGRLGRDVR
jgi:hypothetical protein